MRPVLSLDRIRDERDEAVFVFLVEPRPLSVRVEFEEPQFAPLPDEVETPEPVAGLGHKTLYGTFVLGR